MSDFREIPNLREEINRKTLDEALVIDGLIRRREIEPGVAAAMLRSIWTVTAGLIDGEISAAISQAYKELETQGVCDMPRTIYLRNAAGALYRIAYPLNRPGLVVSRFKAGEEQPQVLLSRTDLFGADRATPLKAILKDLATNNYRII